MTIIQRLVKQSYAARDYTTDLPTLALGLCEEAGEVGKAVNTFHNPKYIPSEHNHSDSVEHELIDTMIYLFGIANVLDIDLETVVVTKLLNRTGLV